MLFCPIAETSFKASALKVGVQVDISKALVFRYSGI